MAGRLLHTVLHVSAALLFLALAAGTATLTALAVRRPPPYVEWLTQGPFGILAAATLLAGTVLWAALTLTLLIWMVRCARRSMTGYRV